MTLEFQRATTEDFNFVFAALIKAAKQKHFLINPHDHHEREYLRSNLKSVIKHGQMLNGLRMEPLIFNDGNGKVGFAAVSEIRPGRGGHELHLFVVSERSREKGYGSQMLDRINTQWQDVDLYARCFPASERMCSMLQRRGFVYTHTNAEGAKVYLRERIDLP